MFLSKPFSRCPDFFNESFRGFMSLRKLCRLTCIHRICDKMRSKQWQLYILGTGLAFHPLDGILQASPHVVALFLIPTHFFTHEIMLFMEGVWTTNIHDCIDGRVWGIMGAGFHTIHHTTYRHNYGHYTIFMDWLFGTLREPYERKAAHAKSS